MDSTTQTILGTYLLLQVLVNGRPARYALGDATSRLSTMFTHKNKQRFNGAEADVCLRAAYEVARRGELEINLLDDELDTTRDSAGDNHHAESTDAVGNEGSDQGSADLFGRLPPSCPSLVTQRFAQLDGAISRCFENGEEIFKVCVTHELAFTWTAN